jgi:hypothetical protein
MAGKPNEAVVVSKAESAYTIMLTSLSQFQGQGWKKWLSRIRFAVGTLLFKIVPKSSQICLSFNC